MTAPTIFAVVIFIVIASLMVMAILSLFSSRHATAKADGADDEQTRPSPAPQRGDTAPRPQADRPGDGQRPPSLRRPKADRRGDGQRPPTVPPPKADRRGDGQRPRPLRRPKADRREGPPQVQLPADATVTFATEREAAAIDDIFAGLDRELVGLVPVKKRIQEIAALLLVDRARQRFGLNAPRPNLHMCFTGAPGTGKTTVALRMAGLLHRLGYLEHGQLVHAMRNDLVGEYVGQTAPKTKRVLDRAMGGVLFIDEAYYLFRASDSKDYGQEAVDILLQVMEQQRDKLVVILAGYKDRMDLFFGSNPGMSSRIAHHLDFADYELDELVAIGRSMLDQSSYYLSTDAESAFRDYLTHQMHQPRFANARSVRNELEQARLYHAHRLASARHRTWTRDDLMRIERMDIPTRPDDPWEELDKL